MLGSSVGTTRTVAADKSQVTAGEHLARLQEGCASNYGPVIQHANRTGWMPEREQLRFQKGGQRLECRTELVHGGAATSGKSGGHNRAVVMVAMLRTGEQSFGQPGL